MNKQQIKRFASSRKLKFQRRSHIIVMASLFAVATATLETQAATIVTTAGVTETFDVQPAATEWSTFLDGGAAGDVTTADALDARVAGFPAANIIDQLQPSAGSPRDRKSVV